jgi:hypothetical protein
MHQSQSYIEDFEIDEAKAHICELIGFKPPIPYGDNVLIQLCTRKDDTLTVPGPDGKEFTLIIPTGEGEQNVFNTIVALVISKGPAAEEYDYKVGDFILIARQEGIQFMLNNWVLQCIPGDKFYKVVKGLSVIKRIYGDRQRREKSQLNEKK